MVRDAGLILGATPRHRSAVVERAASALPITFSVREFARLAAAVSTADLPANPPERGPALVEIVRRHRGLVPPPPDGDDVPDPMGLPAEAHRVAAALIRDAVERIVDVLAPRAPGVRPPPPV
jgi:protein-tyrosine phosphatase